jgi:uncharacterized protein Usg
MDFKNLSLRNKKIANSRWENVHSYERALIDSCPNKKFNYSVLSGFLAGDGSVQKRIIKKGFRYQIDFFPDDEIMLKVYLNCFYDLYKKIPTIKKQNNFFSVRISSNTVGVDLLSKFKLGLKDWSLNKDVLSIYWLKSFFSCEAYVGKYIKIQTVNKIGMLQISNVLNELSINHKFYSYVPKNKGFSKVFIIVILRKKDMLKYYEKIGFFHSLKEHKLKQALHL